MKKLCLIITFAFVLALLCCSVFLSVPFNALAEYAQGSGNETSNKTVTLFNIKNGLATNDANTVLQTSDGYMWIGGYGGLVRYDGTRFYNFSISHQTSALANIRTLFEGSDGKLYVGTNDFGLFRFDVDKLTHLGTNSSIRCIVENNGIVYVCGSMGVSFVEGNELKLLSNERLRSDNYSSIAITDDGVIFTSEEDNGELGYSVGDKYTAISSSYRHTALKIVGDELYAATDSNAIIVYNVNTKTLLRKIESDYLYAINCLYDDYSKDILWVGSDRGFGYVDLESGELYACEEFSYINNVECIYRDYEGSLWIAGSQAGAYKLSDGCFSKLSTLLSLDNVLVNSTAILGKYLYVATDSGLVIADSQNNIINNSLSKMLEGVRIRCMLTEGDNLWLASYSKYGAIKYSPNDASLTFYCNETVSFDEGSAPIGLTYSSVTGLNSVKPRTLYKLSSGAMAVGTSGQGLYIIDNNVVSNHYVNLITANNCGSILSISEDDNGIIYLGTDGGGVVRLDGDNVFYLTTDEGLTTNIVMRTLWDNSANGLWITCGYYLHFYDGERLIVIDDLTAGAGSILDIRSYNDKLLLFRPTTIIEVEQNQLLNSDNPQYESVGLKEGLNCTITANSFSCVDKDNRLYICTDDGVTVFSGINYIRSDTYIKLVISSVVTDEGQSTDLSSVTLSPQNQHITINFSALTFNGQDYKVCYVLEGLEEHVVKLTDNTDQSINFTGLSGGDYKLRIWTENSMGEKSPEQIISIEKKLAFWERWYVRVITFALVLALLGVLFFVFYKIRMHIMLDRHKELQSITLQAVRMVAKTIDAKDHYTNGHSYRVAQYACAIGERLGMSKDELQNLYYIGLMHDIGKIGVPDDILNKPSRLSNEEFEIIKSHVAIGGEILNEVTAIPHISEGAKYHHERYDGKGYCNHLKGEEIPLIARIICVADCFDAMNSDRIYRPRLSQDVIIAELTKGMGTQFDPDIVPIMIELIQSNHLNDFSAEIK